VQEMQAGTQNVAAFAPKTDWTTGKKGEKQSLDYVNFRPYYSMTNPSKEFKDQAQEVERKYMAQHYAVADRRESHYEKEVKEAKVKKVADIVTEEKKVKAIEWQQHLQKTVRVKKTELDAKKRVIDEKNAAHEADDVAAYSVERQQKATFALQEAMKGVEKLKDGKGLHAESDRNKAVSMLAKLRIAHAYSAKKLIGLEPKLQKDPCLDLLRSSVELATGVPTKTHIAMAKQQLRMTVDCRKKESYGKVDRENARVKKNMDDEIMANKKAADRKIRTDREAQLRIQEKAGKTDDNLY